MAKINLAGRDQFRTNNWEQNDGTAEGPPRFSYSLSRVASLRRIKSSGEK